MCYFMPEQADQISTQASFFFFLCRQKEKCSLFLQTKLRQTYSGWAAFWGSSVSDVCASGLKIIIRLTGKLLTDCVNWLLSSIFPRSLFCFIGRKRDAPSGSFQSLHFIFCGFGCQKKKKIFSFIVHQILTVYQLGASTVFKSLKVSVGLFQGSFLKP